MLEFDKGALYLNNFISSKESKRELAYPGDETEWGGMGTLSTFKLFTFNE